MCNNNQLQNLFSEQENCFEKNIKIDLNCQPEFYKIIELFVQDCNGKLFECY